MKLLIKNVPDTSRTQIYNVAEILGISKIAKQRLKWMMHFEKYRNARLTCRHYGISPDTFYLWKRRFDIHNIKTLEDNSKNRKPQNLRKAMNINYRIDHIANIKKEYPKLGKIKIARVLRRNGIKASLSTISRVLRRSHS